MKTAAVILAGGMSRRMGRDKAALPFGEETMLSRLVRIYRPWFDVTAVSVNQAGRFDTAGAMEVVDRHPGDGPLAGLEAALLDTGADVLFLTATDLPLGDPGLARYLMEARGERDICLIRGEKGPEPLFAVYTSACLNAVQACLQEGRRTMFGMIERLNTLELPEREIPGFDVRRILTNVNDPGEYARVLNILKEDGTCPNSNAFGSGASPGFSWRGRP